MHMADALLSPAIGGAMWAVSAGTIVSCSAKVSKSLDDRKVPLMGVMGAFLFAAQMINFTIPATGSSGHLGGGLLLAALLGPHAAFLTIASVLMIQALFFADGGLLALGCNLINLGLFPAFVAYPLIYRPIAGKMPSTSRMSLASISAAIVGLQLGAFSVVLETVLSGQSALPFTPFVSLMQPIHLGIGVVEGTVTAIIIGFVRKARPDIFGDREEVKHGFMRSLVPAFLALALVTGGFVSWFASEQPDGLEWAIGKITGKEELEARESLHSHLAAIGDKLAVLPGYNFRKPADKGGESGARPAEAGKKGSRLGTSLAGVVGALLTMVLALLAGFVLRRRQQLAATKPHSHEHAHPHYHQHDHLHGHGTLRHSHVHDHEHSHPHPHVHDHSRPHAEDPDFGHAHAVEVAPHSHRHEDHEHDTHDHEH